MYCTDNKLILKNFKMFSLHTHTHGGVRILYFEYWAGQNIVTLLCHSFNWPFFPFSFWMDMSRSFKSYPWCFSSFFFLSKRPFYPIIFLITSDRATFYYTDIQNYSFNRFQLVWLDARVCTSARLSLL